MHIYTHIYIRRVDVLRTSNSIMPARFGYVAFLQAVKQAIVTALRKNRSEVLALPADCGIFVATKPSHELPQSAVSAAIIPKLRTDGLANIFENTN